MVSPKLALKLLDRKINKRGEMIQPEDAVAAEMREYGVVSHTGGSRGVSDSSKTANCLASKHLVRT